MSFDRDTLAAAVADHGTVVRILVLRSAGSAPRDGGTSMLVWADGMSGTIGGGTLECRAITDARAVLSSGSTIQHRTLPLGPALGQCCGGAVTLVWERFNAATLPQHFPFARSLQQGAAMPASLTRRLPHLGDNFAPFEQDGWIVESALPQGRPLWVWGAGHVGRALVDVLAPLPDLSITWVDTARERFPAHIPEGVTILPAAEPTRLAPHAPRDADHIVLTYSHELDLALCHALLGHGFASLGLIGSATKWARFRSRLAALGHIREQIARIACPIGDPSLGKHPHAIALGVATSLLRQVQKQTDNRGTLSSERDTA